MWESSNTQKGLSIQASLITELYALNVPPSLVRIRIREQFEQHSHVQDAAVLDVLIHKGRQDLQETLNVWKQVSDSNTHTSVRSLKSPA